LFVRRKLHSAQTRLLCNDKMSQTHGKNASGSIASSNPIYFKLGGMVGITSAVTLYLKKILDDPELRPFFEGVPMTRLWQKQVGFLAYAFGSAEAYFGKTLPAAHYHLIREKGLDLKHFDAVTSHFIEALRELKIDNTSVEEAAEVLRGVRHLFDPAAYGIQRPGRSSKHATSTSAGSAQATVMEGQCPLTRQPPTMRPIKLSTLAKLIQPAIVKACNQSRPDKEAPTAGPAEGSSHPAVVAHLAALGLQGRHSSAAPAPTGDMSTSSSSPSQPSRGHHARRWAHSGRDKDEEDGGYASSSSGVSLMHSDDEEATAHVEAVQLDQLSPKQDGKYEHSSAPLPYLPHISADTPSMEGQALANIVVGEQHPGQAVCPMAHLRLSGDEVGSQAGGCPAMQALKEAGGRVGFDPLDTQASALSFERKDSDQSSWETEDEMAIKDSTLYEKLGSVHAITACVQLFYSKILQDPMLAPFFEGVDMHVLSAKQAQFLIYAFGGSSEYSGKNLKEAHAKLIKEKGANLVHFDRVAQHFVESLVELNVKMEYVDQATIVLLGARSLFDPQLYELH